MFERLKKQCHLVSSLLTLTAFVLWLFSSLQARGIQTVSMNELGLGLFSILPFSFYVAFSLLILSFFINIQSDGRYHTYLLISQTLLLILFLNLTPAIVEGTPRFTTSYLNYRPVDYISQTGHIDPYALWVHNWPGFSIVFSIFTQLTEISGNSILLAYPTIFNAVLVFPLFIFFRTILNNDKVVWLAVWFVSLANWVGQDYFSMQSYAFFVIILLLFLLFKYLNQPERRRQWALLVFLLFFYLVSSHLLSALAILAVFFVFYMFKHLSRFTLVSTFIVLVAGWTLFNAIAYVSSNLSTYVSQFLDISLIFQRNVITRLTTGSEGHVAVAEIRIIYSLAVLAFAIIGILLTIKNKKLTVTDKRVFLLLIGFCLLLFAFAYGGELFMRLYLLSLLPLGYFASRVILQNKRVFYVALLFFVIAAPSLITVAHYGNETMDYVPPSETRGVNFLYGTTTSGQVIGGLRAADFREPYYHQNYTLDSYRDIYQGNRSSLLWIYPRPPYEDRYLCISYETTKYFSSFAGEPQFISDIQGNITNSVSYDMLYSNPSFSIYYSKSLGQNPP